LGSNAFYVAWYRASMNKSNVTEIGEVDHSPATAYEVIVLNWLEQIRSSSSADELIELEEIN
jgi:hypothetical protein